MSTSEPWDSRERARARGADAPRTAGDDGQARGGDVSERTRWRVSVVDELAAILRARILDGDLEAGEPLRELELSAEYGVSRHTLRAAFRALAGEGLVRSSRTAAPASRARADRADRALRAAYSARARGRPPRAGANGGRLPRTCTGRSPLSCGVAAQSPRWRAVAARTPGSTVRSSRRRKPSARAAYATLAGELRSFSSSSGRRGRSSRMASTTNGSFAARDAAISKRCALTSPTGSTL